MDDHNANDHTDNNDAPEKKRTWFTYVKYLLGLLLFLVIAMVVMIMIRFRMDAGVPYEVTTEEIAIPKYTELEMDFTHKYVKKTSMQATGGAIINLDDGVEELFLCGGENQDDAIFRFEDGKFKNITSEVGYKKDSDEASMSSTSLDVDGDGDNDLIVTRTKTIWLYTNNDGKLSGQKLDAPIDKDTTPLSIAVCDINNDGAFDMYVCGYILKTKIKGYNIFNREGYGGRSAMLINNGDNSFTDKTEEFGLYYKHNTFQAVFSDVDADNDLDLVVAHDTGKVRTWKNTDNKFVNTPNPVSDVYGYPMGVAVGDYDNDGRIDFFFSNTGTSAPEFMARGDLRDDQVYHKQWIMFHNDGDFKFTDTADKTKVADYEFSWGCVFEDLNLDGNTDLLVSENYVDLPPYKLEFLRLPGRLLIQNDNGEFAARGEEAGVINKRFGMSPLTADFNGDGAPDIVHVNLAGKSKVFLSQGVPNNFLKVQLPNTAASVGAIVKAELTDGRTIYEPFVKGEGLCSDSSPIITVGAGKSEVKSVEVLYVSGKSKSFDAPEMGSTIEVPAQE